MRLALTLLSCFDAQAYGKKQDLSGKNWWMKK